MNNHEDPALKIMHEPPRPPCQVHTPGHQDSSTNLQRPHPFLWVTWLSKLMAGERQCQWASWFRCHYEWNKVPSGCDLARWTADHAELVRTRRATLQAQGFTVYTEEQNSFTLMGTTGIEVSGKPDIVAIQGTEAYVEDCKTGTPRHSDHLQVLVYMLSLPPRREPLERSPAQRPHRVQEHGRGRSFIQDGRPSQGTVPQDRSDNRRARACQEGPELG